MAKIIYDRWCYRCGKCNEIFMFPGIAPDADTLRKYGWRFCPKCGEPIEYESH